MIVIAWQERISIVLPFFGRSFHRSLRLSSFSSDSHDLHPLWFIFSDYRYFIGWHTSSSFLHTFTLKLAHMRHETTSCIKRNDKESRKSGKQTFEKCHGRTGGERKSKLKTFSFRKRDRMTRNNVGERLLRVRSKDTETSIGTMRSVLDDWHVRTVWRSSRPKFVNCSSLRTRTFLLEARLPLPSEPMCARFFLPDFFSSLIRTLDGEEYKSRDDDERGESSCFCSWAFFLPLDPGGNIVEDIDDNAEGDGSNTPADEESNADEDDEMAEGDGNDELDGDVNTVNVSSISSPLLHHFTLGGGSPDDVMAIATIAITIRRLRKWSSWGRKKRE